MFTAGSSQLREPAPPAAAEVIGRLILAAAIIALAFGLLTPSLSELGPVSGLEILMGARLSLFALTALVADLVQGARMRTWVLGIALLLCGMAAWMCQAPGGAYGLDLPDSETQTATRKYLDAARALGSLQTCVLTAVFLGTWMARSLKQPGHLLVVILCASAGDVWMNLMHVPESVSGGHPLRLLRLDWPPVLDRLHAAPSLPDLAFLALYMEAARRFALNVPSVVAGALGGYAAASFLSLATWRIMLALPLVGLGVLLGVWPRIRCTAREVLTAFALALLLFALLLSLTLLRLRLNPPPRPRPDDFYLRHVA